MIDKPRILSLFPNLFNKFNKPDHSCKILYVFPVDVFIIFCSETIHLVLRGIILLLIL